MKNYLTKVGYVLCICTSVGLTSCNNEDSLTEDTQIQNEVALSEFNATISNRERQLTRAINDAARQVENATNAFDRTSPSQTRNYNNRGQRLISRIRAQIGATTTLIDFQLNEEGILARAIINANNTIDVFTELRTNTTSPSELARLARERANAIAIRNELEDEGRALRRRIINNSQSRGNLRGRIRAVQALLR